MVIGLKDYKRAQAEKARQKRELTKQITELNKQRDELFGKWVFKKAMDEDFLRKEAQRVYLDIQKLQARYDAI